MNRRVCAAIGVGLLLAGCAVPQRPSSSETLARWHERQPDLTAFTDWDLQGRLSIRVADEAGQASLRWRRRSDHQELNLAAPFGQGLLRFTEDESGAHARDAKGRTYAAADLPALVFELTGWRIPVARLQYWVRGLPAPDMPAAPVLDDQGRMRTLDQDGWRVRVAEYMVHQDLELPRRLFLSFAGNGAAPTVDLRLSVDSWSP